MFKLNLNSEDILMKITVAKVINNKDVITNFLGNLLTRAGGDIADKVNIILTNDTLYLEYIGHAAIGYAEEVRDLEKIALKDLKGFSVISNENEELIKIMFENHTLDYSKIKNNADLILSFYNMIYDLNFKSSLKELSDNKALNIFTNRIYENFNSEKVKEQTKKVFEYTQDYLNQNI